MPPQPPVVNVVKFQFQHHIGSQQVVNILHWHMTNADGSAANLALFCEAAETSWETHILPDLSTELILDKVVATDLTNATAPEVETSSGITGGASGAVLSAGSAVVVQHKILRRYRGGHPRTYLGGIVQGVLATAQQLHPANVTTFLTDWASFENDVNAFVNADYIPLVQCVVSYRDRNVARVVPLIEDIQNHSVQPRICSQRRRNGVLL